VNDRAVELLEQYEIEVFRTRKGRGAIICETNRGNLILKEYTGTEERIRMQNRLLQEIAAKGTIRAEELIPTKEGALFVTDHEGTNYILKTWADGRECNIYDKSECLEAVTLLARLHECMELADDRSEVPVAFSPEKEYEKRNKELKKVRKYLKKRGQKTAFEINLLNTFDYFLEQATEVAEEWSAYCGSPVMPEGIAEDTVRATAQANAADTVAGEASEQKALRQTFCHGDYQYHNIIKATDGWFLVNFEKCLPDDPIRDLYLLLRKLLEKGNWSVALGKSLMETYEKERPIGAMSRVDLYYRLAYPEKFWKIVNYYYNSGKAWIPGRNQEKLEKLLSQEAEKQKFLDELFRDVTQLRK